MKSTTACDDQFIAGEDLAAGDLVIYTPEGTLVKGNLRVTPPAPPAAQPPKTYGAFIGDPNVGTERALFQNLQDSTAVYAAMLRGDIAKLSWRQMVHLCGPVPNTADEQMAEIVRLRSEVKELKADPVPAPAVPTDEQIHAAYRNALGQSIRERDMPEIRKFARALLQSAEVQAVDKWQLTPATTHPVDRKAGEVRHD